MATMILIGFLVVIAALAGWWLKRERVKQKEDLVRQGKIARGRFDEVVLPKKKPKKRKRKKRPTNWLDPKYEPPVQPSSEMMKEWIARAQRAVDRLMPLVHAKRAALAAYELAKKEQEQASHAVTYADLNCEGSPAAVEQWYAALEDIHVRAVTAKTKCLESGKAARSAFSDASNALLDLRSVKRQAEEWELYKAPDSFHDMVELVSILSQPLERELDFSNKPQVDGLNEEPEALDWKPRRKFFWNKDNDEEVQEPAPPPVPVENTEIVASARAALVAALPALSGLIKGWGRCYESYQAWKNNSRQSLSFAAPAKSAEQEVEEFLESYLQAARNNQEFVTRAHFAQNTLAERCQEMRAALAPVAKLIAEMQEPTTVVPAGDMPVRDAVMRAHRLMSTYVTNSEANEALRYRVALTYQVNGEETQAVRDAAAGLRNQMRKAAFALGLGRQARAVHDAAKGEAVPQAEAVAPVLTQSSAAAFINSHARMTEITGRNAQKRTAQGEKVKTLDAQAKEKEAQGKQAVAELAKAVAAIQPRVATSPAFLEVTYAAASRLCAVHK